MQLCRLFVGSMLMVALSSAATAARADFELTLQETGNAAVSGTVVGNTASYTGPVGTDFTVTSASADDNSPGTATSALIQVAAISIINNNPSSAETITITVSGTGFTAPTAPQPLTVSDTVSGTLVSGTVSGTAQGFADTSNALGATGFASSLLAINASGDSASFAQDGGVTGFNPASITPFSLTFTETLTLGAGDQVTLTGGNDVISSPEPPSLAIWGLGLAGLLSLAYARRRKRTLG